MRKENERLKALANAPRQQQGQGQQKRGKREFTTKAPREHYKAPGGKDWFKVIYYCHSDGFQHSHPSNMCERPCPGHKDEATWDASLGGCNKNHDKKGQWYNHKTNSYVPNDPATNKPQL